MASQLVHLNGGVLCAVDVETTGPTTGFHDMVQICVLPLDSQIKPLRGIMPFYTDIKPKRPWNCLPEILESSARDKVCHAQLKGLDGDVAADLFDDWYNKLGLVENRRIFPLACNWPHDRSFIIDWLGQDTFERYFDARFRDVMCAASFENDRADFRTEPFPYNKVNLQFLCSSLKVLRSRPHNSLDDCVATAEIYRLMIKRGIF